MVNANHAKSNSALEIRIAGFSRRPQKKKVYRPLNVGQKGGVKCADPELKLSIEKSLDLETSLQLFSSEGPSKSISHFRVPPGLCIKTRLSAQPLTWK